jgi:zinc protease
MSIPGPESINRYELPNGIVILIYENHAASSVVVRGSLRVGAYDERPEQAGLAAFTADALTRGTSSFTFAQIYEETESVGASIGFRGGVYTTGFGTKSLAENLDLVLRILADCLRNPIFPRDGIEKLRGEILTDLQERAHDTQRMASLTFRELLYSKEHPFGRSPAGYLDTIGALSQQDLAEFHASGYGPQGMVIAVVGALETADALGKVEAVLGDWEGHTRQRAPLPETPVIADVRERRISIAGKSQSDIVLGWPGLARSDPDFMKANLANTVLGVFGMMGRLGANVREGQGLAYYVYSHLDAGLGAGPWSAIAGVNPANVRRTVDGILHEVRRLRDEPVPAGELADSQAFLTGSMPLRLETNEGVARTLLDMERYALGFDYLLRYADLVNAVTVDHIQEMATTYLDPEAYALAVAGPEGTNEQMSK